MMRRTEHGKDLVDEQSPSRKSRARIPIALAALSMSAALSGCAAIFASIFPPAHPLAAPNASAVLSGPVIGSGSDNSTVTRQVTLEGLSDSAVLQVPTTTQLSKPSSGASSVYLAVPVKNTGKTPLAWVQMTNMHFYDAKGVELGAARQNGFVYGSVCTVPVEVSLVNTSTCLAPGETAYVLLPEPVVLYNETSKITYQISAGDVTPGDPQGALVPQSYSVTNPGAETTTITQTFKNTGNSPVDFSDGMADFFGFVALDPSNGRPVGWSLTSSAPTPSTGLLNPGSSGTISGTFTFAGTSSKLALFTSFRVPSSIKETGGGHGKSLSDPGSFPSHARWIGAVIDARTAFENEQMRLAKAHEALP